MKRLVMTGSIRRTQSTYPGAPVVVVADVSILKPTGEVVSRVCYASRNGLGVESWLEADQFEPDPDHLLLQKMVFNLTQD